MKLTNLFISIALVAVCSACNKKTETRDAVIIHTDDITANGCGYLLQFEDQSLVKPNYLPSAFQHNGMKVKVKYQHTGVMDTCDYGSKVYDLADIDKINRIPER